MKTLAVSARLATLALTAALGSAAFAQTPEQAESRITLAMNEAPLAADWQPTLAASGEIGSVPWTRQRSAMALASRCQMTLT